MALGPEYVVAPARRNCRVFGNVTVGFATLVKPCRQFPEHASNMPRGEGECWLFHEPAGRLCYGELQRTLRDSIACSGGSWRIRAVARRMGRLA